MYLNIHKIHNAGIAQFRYVIVKDDRAKVHRQWSLDSEWTADDYTSWKSRVLCEHILKAIFWDTSSHPKVDWIICFVTWSHRLLRVFYDSVRVSSIVKLLISKLLNVLFCLVKELNLLVNTELIIYLVFHLFIIVLNSLCWSCASWWIPERICFADVCTVPSWL